MNICKAWWHLFLNSVGQLDNNIYLIYPKLSMNFIPNLKYKTEMCHLWMRGEVCDREFNCFFAHGEGEIRTIEQTHTVSPFLFCWASTQNQAEMGMKNLTMKMWQQAPENYKTVYCKFYTRGQCKLGDHCTFAHSKKEKKRNQEAQNRQTGAQWLLEYQRYLAYAQFQVLSYSPENGNNIQRKYEPNYAEGGNLTDSRKLIRMHSYDLEESQAEKVERRTKSQESEQERVIEAAKDLAKLNLVQKTEDSKTHE